MSCVCWGLSERCAGSTVVDIGSRIGAVISGVVVRVNVCSGGTGLGEPFFVCAFVRSDSF